MNLMRALAPLSLMDEGPGDPDEGPGAPDVGDADAAADQQA